MFLYADIKWIISSYGSLAGIDAGDGFNHITIPESRTLNILNIDEASNVGTPGVWIFKIGEGTYAQTLHTCILYIHTRMQCMHVRSILYSIQNGPKVCHDRILLTYISHNAIFLLVEVATHTAIICNST